MIKLMVGLALGLVLGGSVAALAAEVLGSGEMDGWIVVRDGQEVCRNPEADDRAKIIDCDCRWQTSPIP